MIVDGQVQSIGWEEYPASEHSRWIDDLVAWVKSEHPEEAGAFTECIAGSTNCWSGSDPWSCRVSREPFVCWPRS